MSIGDFISLSIDLIPIAGNVKSFIEFVRGKDSVTGEELDEIDRGFCALDLIPIGKFGKVGKKIRKIVDVTSTSYSIMGITEQEVS